MPGPEPFLELAVTGLHGGPSALDKDRLHIRIAMQRFAAYDLIRIIPDVIVLHGIKHCVPSL